ncbi:hypothetical protein AWZ03_003271 [Drosophila navojoa]|uniref:HTH CENPB-type domain-containing protein n=1 Tax=Drosophila navojoa TaxID=7232 RepID=A0A484BNB5_DRONA|nr:uncharacterized protein LOC108652250 [Drosophila navojoa]TDG50366.1 hypothetical protein AWZ03_003271 [Drosophila navojoa]
MRVRDKRKQHKEQKAQKGSDKQKPVAADVEEKPIKPATTVAVVTSASTPITTITKATVTTSKAITTTAKTPPTASKATATRQSPPLPPLNPSDRIAFDNRIKRKNVLALNEKVAALREYERQPVYKHVGRMFHCSPDQIKRIVQQKEQVMRAWEQRTRRCQDNKTQELKVVRVSMLGKAVFEWIRRMMYYKDFIISDGLIQKMALQFKSSMGLNNFFPHQEWCDKFRATYGIHHNDTKLLKFAYLHSSSVQINDIVKDVMSECTPAKDVAPDLMDEDEEDEEDFNATVSNSSHLDDDEGDVDIDGGGDSCELEPQDVKPSLSELNAQILQPLPQIVRLPQVPPGTSQKVLLATPILPPGVAPAGAQTMTIIPLATLTQSITQRPVVTPPKKPAIPPPKLDIKQEIKTEPTDTDDQEVELTLELAKQQQEQQQQLLQQQAEEASSEQPAPEHAAVCIKQELDSDGEYIDDDDDDNGGRSSVTSLAEILAANVDDEKQYIEQTRAMRQHKRSRSPAKEIDTPMITLPPMPTLTKAPTQTPTVTPPPQQPKRRRLEQEQQLMLQSPQTHDKNNNGQSIISCGEARKYLKLLKEFATFRKNTRLIELTTRADEVLWELDDDKD